MSLIDWAIRRLTAKSAFSGVVFWVCFGPVAAYIALGIGGIAKEVWREWDRFAVGLASAALGREIRAESIEIDLRSGVVRASGLYVGDPTRPAGPPFIDGGMVEAQIAPLSEAMALASKTPAAIPKRVALSGATVAIRRDADGAWNFRGGLRPGPPRAIDGLGFPLTFSDCDVTYDDAVVKKAMRSPVPITGKRVHGFIFLGATRGHLQVAADRPSGGTMSVSCSFDYPEPNYSVRVTGVGEDAATARGLAQVIELRDLAGRLDYDLEVSKESQDTPLYLDCTAHLYQGSAGHRLFEGRASAIDWEGRFDLSGVTGSGSCLLAGSPLDFSIAVHGYAAPRVEGRISSDQVLFSSVGAIAGIDSRRIPARIGRSGTPLRFPHPARAQAAILWSREAGLGAYGSVSVPAIGVGTQEISAARCDFNYADGMLALTRVDLGMAGGRASCAGVVDLRARRPAAQAIGSLSGADLGLCSAMVEGILGSSPEAAGFEVGGKCDALFSAQYGESGVRAAGRLEIADGRAGGHAIPKATIEAEYDGGRKVGCECYAEDPDGAQVWGSGEIDIERGFDLDLAIADLRLASLTNLGISEELSGTAWAVGHLAGPVGSPRFEGACSLFGAGLRGYAATAAHAQVDATLDRIRVEDMSVFAAGGELSLSGDLSNLRGDKPGLQVEGRLDHISLDALGVDVLDSAGASGVVSGTLAVAGTLADPRIDLQAQVAGGSVYSYPFGDAEFVGHYSSGSIGIERLSAQVLTQRINVSGSVRPGGDLAVSVDAVDLGADAIAGSLDPLKGLGGKFDAHAEITGRVASPSAVVSFASTGMIFAGEPLGATLGTISVADGVVEGRDFISELGDQSVRIDRVFYNSRTKRAELSARAERFELATLVRMARSPDLVDLLPTAVVKVAKKLRGSAEGVFSAQADLRSEAGVLSGVVEARGDGITLQGTPVGDLETRVELAQGAIGISRFELGGEHGVVEGSGSIAADGGADISLRGTGIDIPYIGEWLAQGLPVEEGEADFQCKFTGRPDDRALQASFSAANLRIPLVPIDRVECKDVELAASRLALRDVVMSWGDRQLVASADLPFDAQALLIPRDEPIKLTATLRDAEPAGSDVGEAGRGDLVGRLVGGIDVGGTLDQPELSGEFALENGTLLLPCMVRPAEQVNLRVRIDDRGVELSDLEARMGDGTLTASGRLDLEGLKAGPMSFNVSLEKARLGLENVSEWYRERFDGELTGEFTITNAASGGTLLPVRGPMVTGSATIGNAVMSIPRPPAQPRPPRPQPVVNPSLDIRVESSEDVAVRLPNARVYAAASFSIKGSLASPQIAGDVVSTRGRMYYLGNSFSLNSGEVQLTYAPPVSLAVVSAQAETRTANASIAIDISGAWGPFSNLSVDLTSSPPMSESEILAELGHGRDIERILSGRTWEAFLSDETWRFLASAFQPGWLMPLEDVLTEALGLESVSLGLGFGGQSYVSLEKRIFRDLYLGYTQSLTGSEPRETLRLFWRINRYSEAYWSQDPEWGQRIGVTGRWRF